MVKKNGTISIITYDVRIDSKIINKLAEEIQENNLYFYYDENPGMDKGIITDIISNIIIYFDANTVKNIVADVISSAVFSSIWLAITSILNKGKSKNDCIIEFEGLKLKISANTPPEVAKAIMDKFVEEKLKKQTSILTEEKVYEYDAETGNFKLYRKKTLEY